MGLAMLPKRQQASKAKGESLSTGSKHKTQRDCSRMKPWSSQKADRESQSCQGKYTMALAHHKEE